MGKSLFYHFLREMERGQTTMKTLLHWSWLEVWVWGKAQWSTGPGKVHGVTWCWPPPLRL